MHSSVSIEATIAIVNPTIHLRIQKPEKLSNNNRFNSSKEVGTGNVTSAFEIAKELPDNKKFHSAQCLKLLLLMHLNFNFFKRNFIPSD
jgi:hypothetical protein